MAIFFGISGGLTAIGPIAGGYLTQWTWRAIFWINIPVAIIALFLIWLSKPDNERHPGEPRLPRHNVDHQLHGSDRAWASTVRPVGMGQRRHLGMHRRRSRADARVRALGAARPEPLLQLRIFKNRAFAVDNIVLAAMSVVFIPFFFFASVYSQVALGKSSTDAGVYILYFFIGFVVLSQIGGRMLDRRGARPPIVIGCALGAVGFYLLAGTG